jgi:glutathione synthase/RimK-type ligase-like ATP-grasp enzyme
LDRARDQNVKNGADGSAPEGAFRTFDLGEAPAELSDIAVRAIGDGFYGVDIKQTYSSLWR